MNVDDHAVGSEAAIVAWSAAMGVWSFEGASGILSPAQLISTSNCGFPLSKAVREERMVGTASVLERSTEMLKSDMLARVLFSRVDSDIRGKGLNFHAS